MADMAKEITVTKALTKLKTLGNKIHKKIENANFVTYEINSKEYIHEDFRGTYDSIKDLINYRDKLKSAIANSNATTKVKINNVEYSVVEAIEMKHSIQFKKSLLERMRYKLHNTKMDIEEINESVQNRLDRLIETSLGNEKGKVDNKTIEAISNPFIKRNQAKLVDPIGIENEIEKLDSEIDSFLEEVDIALSESNSRTYIIP